MNIKKTGSGLVVAISMLAFNAAAQADCTDEVEDITAAADALRCAYGEFAGGTWNDVPIWQKAAGNGRKKQNAVGDGCEVHQKLARLLYEKPVVKETKGKGKPREDNQPDGRGAARALADGQFQYAVDLLTELQASIATSVLNPDFTTVRDPETGTDGDAQYWATKLSMFAGSMAGRIHPETQSCD